MRQRNYRRHVVVAVETVKELIDLHPANGVHITSLAATAGISRNLLQRAFRDRFNIEIGQYKLMARMQFAQQLLQKGVPAKEVAVRLGYASMSAFSNAFKKYYNVSPSRWSNNLHPP